MRKAAILGLVVAAAGSQAVTIDNFLTGAVSIAIQSGSFVAVQNGSMANGERDVEARVFSNPFNQFLDVNINNGLNVVSNGFQTVSKVTLQYDANGDEVGNTGSGKFLTNGPGTGPLVASGSDDKIRVNFLGNDLNVKVTAVLRQNGVIQNVVMGNKAAGGPGSLDLAVGAANLSTTDSLTLEFEADPSGDFALGGISTVPEPMTMVALAAGAGLLMRRRFKK